MRKTALALVMVVCLILSLTGCDDNFPGIGTISKGQYTQIPGESSSQEQNPYAYNNLTGKYDLDKSQAGRRPVAVMINNIKTAQSVQTGLNDADVIFESLVEGGITRLMAVYSDISKAGQIGTVRSVRYTYVELADALDAILVHCGADDLYTTPYMKDIGFESFDLAKKGDSVQFREENGKTFEHTLYTKGEMLSQGLSGLRSEIDSDCNQPLFQFRAEDASAPAGSGSCIEAVVPMSQDSITNFRYDQESGKYIRCPNGKEQKDYKTGQPVAVDNVILLYTKVQNFSDDYHLKSILSSGEGVYISQGTYCPIKWKKGDAKDHLVLTNTDGTELTVNAGTSWISLVPVNQQANVELQGQTTSSAQES